MGIRSAGPGTRGAAAVANSSAAFELGSHNANAEADAAADAVASRQAPAGPRLHRSEPGLVLVSFSSVISAQKKRGLSCAHYTHALQLEPSLGSLSAPTASAGVCHCYIYPTRIPSSFADLCFDILNYFNCKSLDNCFKVRVI